MFGFREPCLLMSIVFALCPTPWASRDVSAADSNADASSPISFELDIQPILSAYGCNAGACHGKQRGQNGFQLSLLGFDSNFDYDALVHQARGRRVRLTAPEQSLLVRKATADLPHGGGRKIEPDSKPYQTLVRWIRQGAPRRVADEPLLESIELAESEFSLAPGGEAQLAVTAHYSDGSTRDVTDLTSFLSNEATVADADDRGKITAGEITGQT